MIEPEAHRMTTSIHIVCDLCSRKDYIGIEKALELMAIAIEHYAVERFTEDDWSPTCVDDERSYEVAAYVIAYAHGWRRPFISVPMKSHPQGSPFVQSQQKDACPDCVGKYNARPTNVVDNSVEAAL